MRLLAVILVAGFLAACSGSQKAVSRAGHCFANTSGNYVPTPVDIKYKKPKNHAYLKLSHPAEAKPGDTLITRVGSYQFLEADIVYLQEIPNPQNNNKFRILHMKQVRRKDLTGHLTKKRVLVTSCVANIPADQRSINKAFARAITDFTVTADGNVHIDKVTRYSIGYNGESGKIEKSAVGDDDNALSESPKQFYKNEGVDFQLYKHRKGLDSVNQTFYEYRSKQNVTDGRIYVAVKYLFKKPKKTSDEKDAPEVKPNDEDDTVLIDADPANLPDGESDPTSDEE